MDEALEAKIDAEIMKHLDKGPHPEDFSASIRGCWVWRGRRTKSGEGFVVITHNNKQHIVYVVRYLWAKAGLNLEDGERLHSSVCPCCCCNPAHFSVGHTGSWSKEDCEREIAFYKARYNWSPKRLNPKTGRAHFGLQWGERSVI